MEKTNLICFYKIGCVCKHNLQEKYTKELREIFNSQLLYAAIKSAPLKLKSTSHFLICGVLFLLVKRLDDVITGDSFWEYLSVNIFQKYHWA